jgi:hypothetical protein
MCKISTSAIPAIPRRNLHGGWVEVWNSAQLRLPARGRCLCTASGSPTQLILEITEQDLDGRRFGRRPVLDKG